jgi:hypothetical protein
LPATSLKIVLDRATPRPASTSVISELALSHSTAMRGLAWTEAKTRSTDKFIAGEVMQQHLHARHGFLKGCERRRQDFHRGGRRVTDMQLAVFAASQGADLFHGFVRPL